MGPFKPKIHIRQFWKVVLNYVFDEFLLTVFSMSFQELLNSDIELLGLVFYFFFSTCHFFMFFVLCLREIFSKILSSACELSFSFLCHILNF